MRIRNNMNTMNTIETGSVDHLLDSVRIKLYSNTDFTKWSTFFIPGFQGYLVITTSKKETISLFCTFVKIKKYYVDDNVSLLVSTLYDVSSFMDTVPNDKTVYKKYLVTLENSGKLINKLLLDEPADDLLYKNKPKIKSYGYGAPLYDIIVLIRE